MHEPCTCGCPHCSRCQFQAVLDEVEYHTEQRRAEQECPCSPPPCPSCAAKDAEIARLAFYESFVSAFCACVETCARDMPMTDHPSIKPGVEDIFLKTLTRQAARIRELEAEVARLQPPGYHDVDHLYRD